ncbi:hypothetical protein ABBQ38_010007 [Trebouxia sp. C0009 RCD-2024]
MLQNCYKQLGLAPVKSLHTMPCAGDCSSMSRTSRRQADAENSTTVVQVGANTIFKSAGRVNLLPLVRTAVTTSHQILVEGHMLASLHILRLLSTNQPLPPLSTGTKESKWQTMMDNCYAAVSQAVGPHCQQFSAAKQPELATTYALYQQLLPAGHVKPTRPTWLKHVSLSWHSNFSCHLHGSNLILVVAICTQKPPVSFYTSLE